MRTRYYKPLAFENLRRSTGKAFFIAALCLWLWFGVIKLVWLLLLSDPS